MNRIHLSKQKRIRLFLHEYYAGQKPLVKFMRLCMGPVLAYIGFGLYHNAQDRFGIAYGGLCIVYGIYYTLKPLIWVVFRWDAFKTIEFELELTPDGIKIKEERNLVEADYTGFKSILKRKKYYALLADNYLKIYLPNECLTAQDIETLEMKLKK